MTGTPIQAEVIALLSDPATYADGAAGVETIATHASMIFLCGERAYKLKRAVKYSYLDYSTAELRRAACEAELALNRRSAPELYLSVAPVVRRPDGRLALDGAGDAIDWVVVMRRFPQTALFSHLAETGRLTPRLAMLAADRIAAFHAIAEPTRDQGGAAGIDAVIRINDENLRRSPPLGLATADIDRLRDTTLAAHARNAGQLDSRRDAGKVKRCHGDLHLANIALIDDVPTLFDCIEFSDLIACIDVLYDLAFLLMDLRHRGLPHHAAMICNRYLDVTAEEEGLALLPLFLSLRAAVRAHVTATAAQGVASGAERDAKLAEARAYFDLAEEMLRPRQPRLVAIGGFSGTGKSSIAAAIAGELGLAPGARVLRSDVLRKRLHGAAPEDRLPPAAYAPEESHRVYALIDDLAAKALAAGYSVIIDAVSARPEERAAFAAIAQRAGIGFTGLWLEAAPEILIRRIAGRARDASDATVEVLRRQLTYDLGPLHWTRIDAGRDPALVAADVRRALGLPA